MLRKFTKLYFTWIFFSLSFPFIHTKSTACRPGSRPDKCRFNCYRAEDGTCQECQLGTFGINCTGECPPGFFGRLCLQKCNCSHETCDLVHGCNDLTTVRSFTHSYTDGTASNPYYGMKEKYTWQNIAFALVGSTVAMIVFMGLFSLKLRFGRTHDKTNEENNDTEGEDYQHQNQLPDHAYSQRAETVDEENAYADLRSSRMIEIHNERILAESSQAHAKAFRKGAQNEHQDEYINQMEASSREEWRGRDKDENQYAHCRDNSQYNVLSFQRNRDQIEIRKCSEEQTPRYKMSVCDAYPYSLMHVCELDNDLNTIDNENGNPNVIDSVNGNLSVIDSEDAYLSTSTNDGASDSDNS